MPSTNEKHRETHEKHNEKQTAREQFVRTPTRNTRNKQNKSILLSLSLYFVFLVFLVGVRTSCSLAVCFSCVSRVFLGRYDQKETRMLDLRFQHVEFEYIVKEPDRGISPCAACLGKLLLEK